MPAADTLPTPPLRSATAHLAGLLKAVPRDGLIREIFAAVEERPPERSQAVLRGLFALG